MPIFIGSIPTIQVDDVKLCKDIQKKKVSTNKAFEEVELSLKKRFDNTPFLFNRGRDALYFILKVMGVGKGDEILTQGFSCIAVSAPILWTKAKPVYVDIEKSTFNMSFEDLKRKITPKTKAIIIQHTFGNIVDVKKIKEYIQTLGRSIYLIEDYAHSLITPGCYGDAFFLSFAQDKSITCVQGGCAFFKEDTLISRAVAEYSEVQEQTEKESAYNLKYILSWNFIKHSYFSSIIPFIKNGKLTVGKVAIILFRKLGIIKQQATSEIGTPEEIRKLSDIQSSILLNQLSKVDNLNTPRESIVKVYDERLNDSLKFHSENKILLRYPVLLENPEEVLERLSKERIIAGRWYNSVIFPKNIKEYTPGSCPNAEFCTKHIINLPTHAEVSVKDAERIADIVNKFGKPIKYE